MFKPNLGFTEKVGRVNSLRDPFLKVAASLRKLSGRKEEELVGRDEDLSEIRELLLDDDGGRIIVIHGMIGIGKTTLMRAAAASVAKYFDVVIWSTVGKPWNAQKIQEDIRNQLRLSFLQRTTGFRQRETLIEALRQKKFLIVLDDLQPTGFFVNLEMIGIPYVNSKAGSKVVLITRHRNPVVGGLNIFPGGRLVEIGFLDQVPSWELFCRELTGAVGGDLPPIRPLAERVVAKCGGWPLALIKVAKAVSHCTTTSEWQYALQMLNKSPGRLPGMEDFLRSLKSAYFPELVEDRSAERYLLSCSLFPEDHSISEDQLGELWVAEGLADDEPSSSKSPGKIFRQLTNSGLLICDGIGRVKMHSAVRMMATWLTTDDDSGRFGTILLLADTRCSFSYLRNLSVSRPALQFLNLSDSVIGEEIPAEIGSLVGLRHLNLSGTDIRQLPLEIGSLANLEYLNLSRSGLKELPATLWKLTSLRHLNLRQTRSLSSIPRGTIVCLKQLRTLDLFQSGFGSISWRSSDSTGINLQDLMRCLTSLDTLGLSLEAEADSLLGALGDTDRQHSALEEQQLVLYTQRLRACMKSLELRNIRGLAMRSRPAALRGLKGLRELSIVGPSLHELQELSLGWSDLRVLHVSGFPKIKIYSHLGELHISNCHGFEELTSVAHIMGFEYIRLADCNGVKEVVGDPFYFNSSACPRLKKISLCRLPRLWRIGRGLLRFPDLVELEVRKCPELSVLPFDKETAKTMRKITGEQDWWDKVEFSWEPNVRGERVMSDATTKVAFSRHFRPLPSASNETDGEVLCRLFEQQYSAELLDSVENKERVEEIESSEQGGRKPHEDVSNMKKAKEKVEESASFCLEEERELMIVEEPSNKEAGGQEIDPVTRTHLGDEIASPLVVAGDEGMEMEGVHKDEDSPLNIVQDLKNLHETTVPLSQSKGKEKHEEGESSLYREEGMSNLQAIDEYASGEEVDSRQSVDRAQAHLGDRGVDMMQREKLHKSHDSLVHVKGQEKILSTIREHLQNGFGVIGVIGMGGVGKTTLLKNLRNEFSCKQCYDFDTVIMVTVSKCFQHKKNIQKEIGNKLGLSLSACGPSLLEDVQAAMLRRALSQRKLLLILDGVQQDWEKIDVEEAWKKIGIHISDETHPSKIIFATHVREDVKNVEMVEMNSLDDGESWELFSRNVEDEAIVEDQSIKPLAKQIVAKCDGIPLALITVGRAMASKKTQQDWQDAIDKMDGLAKVFQNKIRYVPYTLKFSYDYLKDDASRFCLLYCSLFPENHTISIEELIQYWFGEGLLHDIDIDCARNSGHTIVKQLSAASLLEVDSDKKNEVKMHDVIRELVLQLTSSAHEQSNIFLVHSGRGLTHAPEVELWRQATRLSLMQNEIENLPGDISKCPNLSTLLINKNTSLKQIPKDFFKCLPALRVLDLSCTGIEELPKAVGLLSKLHFLNLSNTCIRSMPKELGNLIQLRQLYLNHMSSLSSIPKKAIVSLSKLQALSLFNTGEWCIEKSGLGKQKKACIQDLMNLGQLRDLRLTIKSMDSVQELKSCSCLLQTMRCLGLNQIEGLTTNLVLDIFEKLDNLEALHVSEPYELKELRFSSDQLQRLEILSVEDLPQARFTMVETLKHLPLQMLRRFHIIGCHGFRDLKWVCRLPSLEYLELRVCYGIEEISTDGGDGKVINDYSFPKLKKMFLWDLPRLERISESSLFLLSLEHLEVFHCPKLKKLPFNAQSAKNIKVINGHQEWWDGLQCDHESTKVSLFHIFKDPRNRKQMT